MTTLPQTTPVRLPRPVAASPLAASHGSGVPAASGLQMTGSDIVRIIRSNILLIFILMGLTLAGGYGVYYWLLKYHPKYTATALLQIDTSPVPDPINGNSTVGADVTLNVEVRTQVQLLKSEGLFSKVLSNPQSKLGDTEWLIALGRDPKRAKADLMDNLQVTPVAESRLLKVTITTPSPADGPIILRELVDAHLTEQRTLAEQWTKGRTAALKSLQEHYSTQREQKTIEIRDTQLELESKGVSPNRLSLREQNLAKLNENLTQVRSLAGAAKGRYEGAQKALQGNQQLPEVERTINQTPDVVNLAQRVMELQMARETELKKGNLPEHPLVQDYERRIGITQRKLDDLRATKRNELTEQYMNELKTQADSTAADAADLQAKVAGEQETLAGLYKKLADLATATEEERAFTQLHRQVSEQLERWNTVFNLQSRNRISWAQPPEKPEIPSSPKAVWIMSVAGVLGLILALGVAFLRELMDETVRSPRDIAKVGQMNLLGIVSDESDDPQAAGSRLPLVIFDAPHSLTAEQFRQVRTRLQHAASLDTTRSIMVTGPSPMDGKTTVACNLAAGLALNGRKILLVDANFRRPELQRIFDLPNEQGFADVLNGLIGIDEATRETQVPNLYVLVSGQKPMNPTELFESQLLIDFVDRALEEYDHVIFDTGPLLVVSESVAMAPRVDGVVTVVRAHEDSRGLLKRMGDVLRQVKAEHLGVVLNAVRAQGGGYYRRNIRTYYEYQANEA